MTGDIASWSRLGLRGVSVASHGRASASKNETARAFSLEKKLLTLFFARCWDGSGFVGTVFVESNRQNPHSAVFPVPT